MSPPVQPRTAFVVGAGRLGTALAQALPGAAGITVLGTWSRTTAGARRARTRLGGVRATGSGHGTRAGTGTGGVRASSGRFPAAITDADLVLLTVRDDAVAEVCAALVAAGRIRPGQLVVHCAGALDLSPLAAAAAAGATVGALHPLQAFAGEGPPRFAGALALVDGAGEVPAILDGLARALGMRPSTLGPGGSRTLYHAAAVLSAGHLVALLDAALAVAEAAGLPAEEARSGLVHLARGSLAQLEARGPAGALTGPVARGDAGVVARHLEALAGVDEVAEVYQVLARRAVEVAARAEGGARAEGAPETGALDAVRSVLDRGRGRRR